MWVRTVNAENMDHGQWAIRQWKPTMEVHPQRIKAQLHQATIETLAGKLRELHAWGGAVTQEAATWMATD